MRLERLLLCGVVVAALLGSGAPAAAADPVGQINEYPTASGYPLDIAPGPDGNLWFTDGGIGRIDAGTGQITQFNLPSGSSAAAIVVGPDGNLWFTGTGAYGVPVVGKLDPATGHATEYPSGMTLGSLPGYIAVGDDGKVWFTGKAGIGRINPTTGQVVDYTTPGGSAGGIAPAVDGNLWFTVAGGSPAIGRVSPFTGQIDYFSSGLQPGSVPTRIAPGPGGDLWFTDQSNGRAAVGRISLSGQITEYSNGLSLATATLEGIAPGADGNLWFADHGSTPAIGRINPNTGQITEFSAELRPGARPFGIAPGADGNLWFAEHGSTPAIGKIGAGAPAAVKAPPSVLGSGQAGSPQVCQATQWAVWATGGPFGGLYPFDGYRWLRDGAPITPASTQRTFTPSVKDVGHRIACEETVTFPLPLLVPAVAASAPITVQPGRTPVLVQLTVTPRRLSIAGRRQGRRCAQPTPRNRGHKPCRRAVTLHVVYTVDISARVTLRLFRQTPGRKVTGRCVRPTRRNHMHRPCPRWVAFGRPFTSTAPAVPGSVALTGRIVGRSLSPGNYELTATPAANGSAGASRSAGFSIAS